MRILVLSDSHGNRAGLRAAAETVFFLGDGLSDLEAVWPAFSGRTLVAVQGNCDLRPLQPEVELRRCGGVLVAATHGHRFGVKHTPARYTAWAKEHGAQVALFGHTHEPLSCYEDGLYLLNPGTLSGYAPTYGIVDVTQAGIVTAVVPLAPGGR